MNPQERIRAAIAERCYDAFCGPLLKDRCLPIFEMKQGPEEEFLNRKQMQETATAHRSYDAFCGPLYDTNVNDIEQTDLSNSDFVSTRALMNENQIMQGRYSPYHNGLNGGPKHSQHHKIDLTMTTGEKSDCRFQKRTVRFDENNSYISPCSSISYSQSESEDTFNDILDIESCDTTPSPLCYQTFPSSQAGNRKPRMQRTSYVRPSSFFFGCIPRRTQLPPLEEKQATILPNTTFGEHGDNYGVKAQNLPIEDTKIRPRCNTLPISAKYKRNTFANASNLKHTESTSELSCSEDRHSAFQKASENRGENLRSRERANTTPCSFWFGCIPRSINRQTFKDEKRRLSSQSDSNIKLTKESPIPTVEQRIEQEMQKGSNTLSFAPPELKHPEKDVVDLVPPFRHYFS